MKNVWENDIFFRALRSYVAFATRCSFSDFRIEGAENIPDDGAIIFTPNHCNTLMDALVVGTAEGKVLQFGARADIFKKKSTARLLRWIHIVPLARMRDGAEQVSQNYAVFQDVAECLKHGLNFCLFCEGTHNPGRTLQPLKKGVFRMAELAAPQLDKPLYLVPVGLNYEDFFRYMKRFTIRYGEPIRVSGIENLSSAEKTELLAGRMQALIAPEPPARNHGHVASRAILSLLSLPLFAVCTAGASPILIISAILCGKAKDKAWVNTIRYCCSLPLPVLWPFHRGFYLLLNYYDNLIQDIK